MTAVADREGEIADRQMYSWLRQAGEADLAQPPIDDEGLLEDATPAGYEEAGGGSFWLAQVAVVYSLRRKQVERLAASINNPTLTIEEADLALRGVYAETDREQRLTDASSGMKATAVVGVLVCICGVMTNTQSYLMPLVGLLALVAFGLFTRWLQLVDKGGRPVLSRLEWLRRAIAYDPPEPGSAR